MHLFRVTSFLEFTRVGFVQSENLSFHLLSRVRKFHASPTTIDASFAKPSLPVALTAIAGCAQAADAESLDLT